MVMQLGLACLLILLMSSPKYSSYTSDMTSEDSQESYETIHYFHFIFASHHVCSRVPMRCTAKNKLENFAGLTP